MQWVARARAGHPKSAGSPSRVHFSFQANMAAFRLRTTQNSNASAAAAYNATTTTTTATTLATPTAAAT
eukprot:3306788-Pyramimonas_sp.AAC.1